jgi:TRAP-type C4-dicarboxylate transport system permease large subunit
MDSAINYYFSANPPYFLFMASLFAGLLCGKTFEVTLRQLVKEWSSSRSSRTLLNLRGISIKLPYLGMVLSITVFLSTGLEIFGFPPPLAYPISITLTLLISFLVWRQLSLLLVELERGGSAAMDLDMFEL